MVEKKNLPYIVNDHETKCRMMGNDFCEIQIKFEKITEKAD